MAGMSDRIPLIAGNWKMNLDHLQAIAFVQSVHWTLQDARHDYRAVEVAVFPPFTDLRSVQTLVAADKYDLKYGGQDVSAFDSGAYTGEVSGAFLKALDCAYVIIGHSERRQYHHETDEEIGAKVVAAIRHGVVPVLCVGETAEDLESHGPSAVPVAQLRAALANVDKGANIVVAYEPVWAIGTGKTATPELAAEAHRVIRAQAAEAFGDEVAAKMRILYGGSVKPENAKALMSQPEIDGALVGGASLDAKSFAAIVKW